MAAADRHAVALGPSIKPDGPRSGQVVVYVASSTRACPAVLARAVAPPVAVGALEAPVAAPSVYEIAAFAVDPRPGRAARDDTPVHSVM